MAAMQDFIVCQFCQEETDKSIFETCDAFQSCPQCGSVLAEEQIFNFEKTNAESNRLTKSRNVTDYKRRGRQPQHRPNALTHAETALKVLVNGVCEKLQLPKEITSQVEAFLLRKANQALPFYRMNRKYRLVGACTYIICRNNGVSITFKQVAVATSCTLFELGSVVKEVERVFNLYPLPTTVEGLITQTCDGLPFAKECEELAQQLCRISSESMVLVGTSLPQAIAYCVLASLAVNKETKQASEISKLCLKMSQVSEITVVRCIRLLKNFIIRLLEVIPWINMKHVKMSNIHYFIKDVVKYENTCGRFPAEAATPQWCYEKESEIRIRDEKIQNALERIHLRQNSTTSATQTSTVGSELNNLRTLNSTTNSEENVPSETNSSTLSQTSENTGCNDTDLTAMDTTLDREDMVIEELLELGCTPEQVREGYYHNLKLCCLPVNQEIDESEIDSYVRKPEEVNELKRVNVTTDFAPRKKKISRRRKDRALMLFST